MALPSHPTHPLVSVQTALGVQAIGEGVIVRADGVAVALVALTPPDLRVLDAVALERVLDAYTQVLRTCPDRISLLTLAVPLDQTPLLHTLRAAQRRAPDVRSYTILHALADSLALGWESLGHVRTVRWLMAVPSVAPDVPRSGSWGDLLPREVLDAPMHVPGDPVQEALSRARRVMNQLAALGIEPVPSLLSAAEIRALLRMAFDPLAAESAAPLDRVDAPRWLQVVGHDAVRREGDR